eukprot:8211619-Alexandrium_andersonii.AAC.1
MAGTRCSQRPPKRPNRVCQRAATSPWERREKDKGFWIRRIHASPSDHAPMLERARACPAA